MTHFLLRKLEWIRDEKLPSCTNYKQKAFWEFVEGLFTSLFYLTV